MSKTFNQLVADALTEIEEIFPWDYEAWRVDNPESLVLDIREPEEFEGAHLEDALHVPRGILEQACEWDYAETVPEVVKARQKPVLVVCRSGNRSALAALSMKMLGFEQLTSLKMGVKGCNDSDIPLFDAKGELVDPDWADTFFNPEVKAEQLSANQ